jgi:peptidoglycan/LPS O-acetylase OafA/YrhL
VRIGGGAVASSRAHGERFEHRPSLDALRGLAVLVVVAFHAELGIVSGGYLGVSTFFTLSGFLIATLVLLEHDRHGRFAVGAFWRRRFRRLLPIAVVTVGLVVVLVAWLGTASAKSDVGGDAVASLAYVANWHLLWDGTSYADVFATPNPLVHLWSLAVEEQFYVVFPVVVTALVALGRRQGSDVAHRSLRVRLGVLAAATVVASAALPIVFDHGVDRTYYGTDTRAGELAIGVLLAVVLYPGAVGATDARRPSMGHRWWLAATSTVAFLLMALAWTTVADDSLAWRRGGFVLYALGSAALVAAAVHEVGPVGRLGSVGPLRRLGVISYAVYLFHWPVLWVLGRQTDWPPLTRFVVALAVSVLLAEISYRLLEAPIRHTGRVRGAPALPIVAFVAVVALVGGLAVTRRAPPPVVDLAAAEEALGSLTPDPTVRPGGGGELPRVAFFGDSTALMAAIATSDDQRPPDGDVQVVGGWVEMGCGLLPTVALEVHDPWWDTSPGHVATCAGWAEAWSGAIEVADPDLSVVMSGRWEAVEIEVPDAAGRHRLGVPLVDAYARDLLARAVDIVSERGGRAVLVTSPDLRPEWDANPPCHCDREVHRWNELLREVAAADPERAAVVDLAGWLGSLDLAEQKRLRPDGIHFSAASGAEVSRRWLVPQLLALVPPSRGGVPPGADGGGTDPSGLGG